jgi:Fe2+ or Zn2+ uptake regulation protein
VAGALLLLGLTFVPRRLPAANDSPAPITIMTRQAMTQNEILVYQLLCDADRALAKLVERGAVHRIESVNGFAACQLHDCGGDEVSIFMLCTQCERAHEFTDTSIDSRLKSLINDRGFQTAHKVIRITGLCADCQTAQTAAPKH